VRFLTYEGLHPGALAAQVERVRAAFERDDLRAVDLKKLQGGYYRAKLSDAGRLIVQFVAWQGQRAVLALEVLPRHEYEKSRFLRGAHVDEARIEAPVEAPEQLDVTPMKYLHPSRATFSLLDKPLSFDDAQDEVLRRRPPLVVVGSAGSGKTALLLQHLRAAHGRVAYLTESSWLAQTARGLYVALDFDPGEQEADFLSYRQFLDSIEVPAGRPVGFRDFAGFFERHRQKVRFTDAHQCFEEFRGVITAEAAGPLSLDAYLALGVRQSLFDGAQRRQLFELFVRYDEWLKEAGLFEPNLVAHALGPRATARYDFLAIDEVQDLTPAQLQLALRTLTKPGAFVVAGDANQVVHPNFFSWAKVKSLFWQGLGMSAGGEREVAVLKVSYRNSPEVTKVANAVLALKHARFGSIDRESNTLLEPVPGGAGEVRGLSTGSAAAIELDAKTRRSTAVAVVVLRDEDKPAACAHFKTPLVFSVLESKGLEYENVILYRLVSGERRLFAELAEGLRREDLEVTELQYARGRDKTDKSSEAYKFFVNAPYVALTRAVKKAWLVEDDPSHPLLTLLGVPFDGQAVGADVKQASAEDWQREASRLAAHGKLEQVEAIQRQVLRTQATPWRPLDGPGLVELIDKALDPQGVSRKARELLADVCVVHPDAYTRQELHHLGFRSHDVQRAQEDQNRARILGEYGARRFKNVLDTCERYGLEHRSMHGLTPLMLAAHAGNLGLCQALVQRGASLTARDPLGLQPLHHALRRAASDEAFAASELGAAWELLAPASFDVQVDGRLLQVGREQGEFIVCQLMLERLWRSEATVSGALVGIGTAELMTYVERLPEVVIRDYRRKRPYLSSLLSKNEVSSTAPLPEASPRALRLQPATVLLGAERQRRRALGANRRGGGHGGPAGAGETRRRASAELGAAEVAGEPAEPPLRILRVRPDEGQRAAEHAEPLLELGVGLEPQLEVRLAVGEALGQLHGAAQRELDVGAHVLQLLDGGGALVDLHLARQIAQHDLRQVHRGRLGAELGNGDVRAAAVDRERLRRQRHRARGLRQVRLHGRAARGLALRQAEVDVRVHHAAEVDAREALQVALRRVHVLGVEPQAQRGQPGHRRRDGAAHALHRHLDARREQRRPDADRVQRERLGRQVPLRLLRHLHVGGAQREQAGAHRADAHEVPGGVGLEAHAVLQGLVGEREEEHGDQRHRAEGGVADDALPEAGLLLGHGGALSSSGGTWRW
jgi:hypothetical protein